MPEINMQFVHDPDGSGSIGYARLGIHLARSLAAKGVTVYDHLPEPDGEANEAMAHLNEGRTSGIANAVCWVSVPTHARGWWKGQSPSMFTMWESSVLPESFRETLHEFDQVLVPSQQNVDLFSQYHDNVSLVPLGVDPEVWHYVPRQPPDRFFRFLIGGSGSRKGTDLAHKAFRKVFKTWPREGPVPVLILKNPRGEEFYGDRIEMVTGKIDPAKEVELYSTAHCYLQPSRGEGFGLQPLQALAQGIPTILTNAHGHAGFAHLGHGIGYEMKPSDYFIYGDAGDWWEPDFAELCDWMLYVYNNYDRCLGKATRSAEEVATEWTWERTAEKFIDAMGDALNVPYSGDMTWHQPISKRFKVMVNRPYTADIAGTLYHFAPGNEYWELADVKRILFENGLLDPACLSTNDSGLTDEQVKKIPNYTAAHSHCPTCGQRVNSSPTLADEIELQMIVAGGDRGEVRL